MHSEIQSPDCLTDPAHLALWFYFSQCKNYDSVHRLLATTLPFLAGDAPGEDQMISLTRVTSLLLMCSIIRGNKQEQGKKSI